MTLSLKAVLQEKETNAPWLILLLCILPLDNGGSGAQDSVGWMKR